MVKTGGWAARRSFAAAVATVVVAVVFWAPSASAASQRALPVPFGFVGMDADPPTWPNPDIDLSQQLDVMAQSGVDSVRAVIDWANAQPYGSWKNVPAGNTEPFVNVGGVPTDLTDADALVAAVAEHRMTLLPVVIDAPPWDGRPFGGQVVAPRTPGPYAAFVKALVLRYGSNGTFWRANPQIPKDPVEMWQVWNEPNIWSFWPGSRQGYYAGYVALLRAAHTAIKQADPKAKVVLAGLANYSWIEVQKLEQRGGKNLFDVVDVHPYTATPRGVITILGYVRQVLNRTGSARIPIIAGELSWPSSAGEDAIRVGFDVGTTEAGQAAKLAKLLPMLVQNRRRLGLAGFDWYDWAGQDRRGAQAWDFSGLFRYSLSTYQFYAKPAYQVYRADALWMEGCRSKGLLATECLH
jgi:hypothetical protein